MEFIVKMKLSQKNISFTEIIVSRTNIIQTTLPKINCFVKAYTVSSFIIIIVHLYKFNLYMLLIF